MENRLLCVIQRVPKWFTSIIIRYVDRSKLRHLEVPICDLNHVQMLFNRFRNLHSIQFRFNPESLSAEQLIDFMKVLMPACSTGYDCPAVAIWIGERLAQVEDSKRSTSYFRSFLRSVKSLFLVQ